MSVLDVELRCEKPPTTRSPNCSSHVTESSTCGDVTEDPSGYLDASFGHINESDFFTSSAYGDISAIDDSIADAIDFAPRPACTGHSDTADRSGLDLM